MGRQVSEAADRRRHPRQPCDQNTPHVTAAAGLDRCRAAVRDFSRCGIGLQLPFTPEPDQRVALELFNRGGNFWHLKLARVAHATAAPDGSWLVGYEFVYPFTADEFRSLLVSPPMPAQTSPSAPPTTPQNCLAVA